MRTGHRLIPLLGVVCLLAACAKPAPAVVAAPPSTDAQDLARLAAADALVRVGCLDCLLEALREYTLLEQRSATATAAGPRRANTAALIGLREKELGLRDGGFWKLAPDSPGVALAKMATAGPIVSASEAQRPLDPRTADAQLESARSAAAQDELAAYIWLTLACGGIGASPVRPADRLPPTGELTGTTLILYKAASSCAPVDKVTLEAILNGEPRFKEIHYFLGREALTGGAKMQGGTIAIEPDLDRADHHYRLAYEWRQDWPGIVLPIAHLALTAEDFPRALEFYDRALTLLPGQPDAQLGRVKALTYLGRYEDAIAGTEPLLASGEARYWRALNETQLERQDQAWEDITLAERTLATAEVAKLAGIIAIRRQQLDAARMKLEEARRRQARVGTNPPDCDIGFYLQTVLSEQRAWEPALREALEAAACFDAEQNRLTTDIARLETAEIAPERRDRQIARRTQQRAGSSRRGTTARFNAAVASFNLQRRDEARRLAEPLVDDEQFGVRAREIVARSER